MLLQPKRTRRASDCDRKGRIDPQISQIHADYFLMLPFRSVLKNLCESAKSVDDHFRAWQRHDVVIFVSDFAQVFWNFAFSEITSSSFLFCERRLSARPKSDQPLSGNRARSSR